MLVPLSGAQRLAGCMASRGVQPLLVWLVKFHRLLELARAANVELHEEYSRVLCNSN
ncbi:unnamed protein product [Linum tenue]|uniref:Uncharacterized protein n=1 Tax=Linum tenue TaxID=586396 RepID=A0AAV0L2E6_9ROSI|nr:unnamed protein product [Linum tenue]